MVAQENTERLAAIERVIQSTAFRNSETLRRLLRYLAEKAIEGTADQLKEYTIAVDALGKPATYDSRQDSAVRIHVGRLRQKLNEYYRTEGKDDPTIIDVPKGHFKLEFAVREYLPPVATVQLPVMGRPAPVAVHRVTSDYRVRFFPLLTGLLVLVAGVAIWATTRLATATRAAAVTGDYWTPEMQELWKPFLNPERPLIVSTAYPLFLAFPGAGSFRDSSLDTLEQAQSSPRVASIRRALGNPAMVERHSYTTAGDANALFSLGRIFAGRTLNISMTKSAELTWQQLADNNVVMVGGPRYFAPLLNGLASNLNYTLDEGGVHVLHPKPGEPAHMLDHYLAIGGAETRPGRESGELYALITHLPGPVGRSDILSFSSNYNPGTQAAVSWLTSPDLVRHLASKIRKPNGRLPSFYQLVLKVRFQQAVPTEVTLVGHAEFENSPR